MNNRITRTFYEKPGRPQEPLWVSGVDEQMVRERTQAFCKRFYCPEKDKYVLSEDFSVGKAVFMAVLYVLYVRDMNWVADRENGEKFHAFLTTCFDKSMYTLRAKFTDRVRIWRASVDHEAFREVTRRKNKVQTKVSDLQMRHFAETYGKIKEAWMKN